MGKPKARELEGKPTKSGRLRKYTPKGYKGSIRKLQQLEKDQEALELRLAGFDYPQIAEKMGYANRVGAWKAVMRTVDAMYETMLEDAKHVVILELERLDKMFQVAYAEAKEGDWKAMDRALRIMERRERYLGLDKAKRLEVTGSEGGPIDLTVLSIEELEKLAKGE